MNIIDTIVAGLAGCLVLILLAAWGFLALLRRDDEIRTAMKRRGKLDY